MKKIFLAAVIYFTLSGAAMAAPDGVIDSVAGPTVIVENIEINTSEIELLPSDEEITVQESAIAHKMTQAEKAHNAAVNDSWGGAITIIAMCIVVFALIILSLLFLCFGKVSEYLLAKQKKKSTKHHANATHPDVTEIDSGDVIAAIAAALAEHFGGGHDMEETILTIRRMKRAYSPWNSKIYNLRQTPGVDKNAPSRSAF